MTMGKIAISLPVEQIEAAKRAVAEGRATSVSAYVSTALRDAERTETLGRLVDDLIAAHGEPPAEVKADTDAFVTAVEARKRGT